MNLSREVDVLDVVDPSSRRGYRNRYAVELSRTFRRVVRRTH